MTNPKKIINPCFLSPAIIYLVIFFAASVEAQQASYDYDPAGNCVALSSSADSAPAILAQPQNQLFQSNGISSFSVIASGVGLTYQWLSNGVPIVGATGDTLFFPNISNIPPGNFSVVISNSLGVVTSVPVAVLPNSNLFPTNTLPPFFTTIAPVSQSVVSGESATFTLTTDGSLPLSFLWQFNGTNLLSGGDIFISTAGALTISNANTANVGLYSIIVSNAYGTASSANAVLSVVPSLSELLVNPSFESGTSGWIFSGDAGVTTYSHTGNYDAFVNIAVGSVSQAVATVPGALYLISFWIAGNGYYSSDILTASFGDTVGFSATNTLGAFGYQRHTFVASATGTSTLFKFSGNLGGGTFFLDDVSVMFVAPPIQPFNPGITWSNPSPIVYGAPLNGIQLNASSAVPGVFTYYPPIGSVLNVGSNTLSAVFTPIDTVDYAPMTNTINLVVSPALLSVAAANANRFDGEANPLLTGVITGLTNGDNITATFHCNATAFSPPGAYVIVPALLDPDNRQTNYTVTLIDGTLTVTLSSNLVVNQSFELGTNGWTFIGDTGITTAPHTGNYDAFVNIAAGSISQAVPTTPGALYLVSFWLAGNGFYSSDTLTASFGDTIGYSGTNILGGFGYQQENFTTIATGTNTVFTFSGVMGGGTFFIDDVSITLAASSTNAPFLPNISWNNPSPIPYGTSLSEVQLNASVDLAGTFTYDPPLGSVLNSGTSTLSVVFTPTDSTDYTSATDSVSLVVSPAALTVVAASTVRVYTQNNPLFTGTISGLTNGDNINAVYTCGATPLSPPGDYAIVPSLVDPNDRQTNYAVTLTDGILTVTLVSNLLANPGFESGTTGWTFVGDAGITTAPHSGNYDAYLNIAGGAISQAVGTVSGDLYLVSFWLAGNGFYSSDILTASFGGTNGFSATNILGSFGYQQYNFLATATGTNTLFTFSGILGGGTFFLDDVSISLATPQILIQPTNQSVILGGNASFVVGANSIAPEVYQWQFDGTNLSAATNNTLALSGATSTNAGSYTVVITNVYGAITSVPAILSVLGVPVFFVTSPGGLQYSNGQIYLLLDGFTGQGSILIQASTNLLQWTPVFTNPSTFGTIQVVDPYASNYSQRYYRASAPSFP